MGCVMLRSAEECLEAWRHIRPYAEGIQGDRRSLPRLQGALCLLSTTANMRYHNAAMFCRSRAPCW